MVSRRTSGGGLLVLALLYSGCGEPSPPPARSGNAAAEPSDPEPAPPTATSGEPPALDPGTEEPSADAGGVPPSAREVAARHTGTGASFDTSSVLHIDGVDVFSWCSHFGMGPVRFEPGEHAVAPDQEEQLQRLLGAVTGICLRTDEPLCLSGNADRRERRPDELGRQRAEAVKRWLVEHGVAADRIQTVSQGAERPVVEGRTAADRGPNRRVDVTSPDC